MLSTKEKLVLCALAAELPPGRAIVEIGTSAGWTSLMLRDCAHAGAAVHSVDVADKLADEVRAQAGRGVHFHRNSSLGFAAANPDLDCGMLFIDGSHTLLWVLTDLLAVARLMPEGAPVAMHDCDLRHSSLRLLADILEDGGALTGCAQEDTLVYGRLAKGSLPPATECFVRRIGQRSAPDREGDRRFARRMEEVADRVRAGDVRIVGKGMRGLAIMEMLGGDPALLMDSADVRDADGTYCVCSHYERDIALALLERGVAPERLLFGRALLDYAFYHDLATRGGRGLRAYFQAKAGAELLPEAFAFLDSLEPESLLWLCRHQMLLEV